ncbi:hypothetical protein GGS23DRAFT_259063 [Durotheca rogersii]|uniref:uncharacterized protein n=1 Tax=Durotheca rogersii TaxID=419775 RepID=UPI00221ED5CF|nr:uncharacterized protein GGS23DRAFT_259063 [Durotheca rogersii]KAI5860020.1 hypothetical protein GGS23DRAFT_259063 [Durotheca rogersii]
MAISAAGKFRDTATFGFELEFLMLFRGSGTTDPLRLEKGEQQRRVPHPIQEEPGDLTDDGDGPHEVHTKRLQYFGREIAKKLTDAGIITSYRRRAHPEDVEIPESEDEEPGLGDFDEFRYSSYKQNAIVPEETMIWTDPAANGRRMTVKPEAQAGYFWLGLEFVSKAHKYRDFDIAKSDLDTVCKVLRANYAVSINVGKDTADRSSRCATHVHWGISGAEYDLVTVKRILTLMWVAEEKLMRLHATWRQDATKYAALLQKGTNMATACPLTCPDWTNKPGTGNWVREMDQNVPPKVQRSLHREQPKIRWLWRAETVSDLASLVGEVTKLRRASVAITELLPATSNFIGKVRRSQLNTIEFRHMQGSLNPTLIAAWIEVTAEIMCRCIESPPEDFSSFMTDVADCVADENGTEQELLSKLGVRREACLIFRDFNQQQLDEEANPMISRFLPDPYDGRDRGASRAGRSPSHDR